MDADSLVTKTLEKYPWWFGASVYHIYPRSFYDSNSDGIGDLNGIVKKLDYLKELGVDAIWISPFYTSPMADFGYDVSNYQDVDPIFGVMADFENLVKEAHQKYIKVIIDYVPNHTSNKHPWFLESSASKINSKRDWYVWKDPGASGGPPNNWLSIFGGSAWEFDKQTGQYYLHTFLKEQPDLNWDNPNVRSAMVDNVRFWLSKGIDGFRMDAVSWLSKDPKFRDDPLNPSYQEGIGDPYFKVFHSFSTQGTALFDYLNELVDEVSKQKNCFVITEAYPDTDEEISHYLSFYSKLNHNICAPFNFECINFPWDAQTYRGFIDLFQEALLPGMPPIYNMGNHDKPRLASRIGINESKTAAMLLLTLPGIAFIYYGDELGMQDVIIPKNKQRDPTTVLSGYSRDGVRTPMQWSAEKFSGFSKVEPWLPVSKNYQKYNVQKEALDEDSHYSLYKKLLALRNKSDVIKFGSYRSLNLRENVFGFVREYQMSRLTVLLNFSGQKAPVVSKSLKGHVILSTLAESKHPKILGSVVLAPYEGVIVEAS